MVRVSKNGIAVGLTSILDRRQFVFFSTTIGDTSSTAATLLLKLNISVTEAFFVCQMFRA